MWSIDRLEDIRNECMKDVLELYPELSGRLMKPRIEINHKTTSALARYSRSQIEISAYLLAESTQAIFFQTLIMKGLIRGQIIRLEPDLSQEDVIWDLDVGFPGKYDFEEYKNLQKQNIELPEKKAESYKYAVRCPKCGRLFKYKRICKTVLNPEQYVCMKCNVPLEHLT